MKIERREEVERKQFKVKGRQKEGIILQFDIKYKSGYSIKRKSELVYMKELGYKICTWRARWGEKNESRIKKKKGRKMKKELREKCS